MLGRDKTRNPVSPESGAPVEWDIRSGRNIKWRASLGSFSMSDPVIAHGLVWVGTNNDPPSAPGMEKNVPLLKCFRESDGRLVWQYAVLPTNGRALSFGFVGFHSSPLVEEDRAWLTTHYGQVRCLDLTPLYRGSGPPTRLWDFDMIRSLGVAPFYRVMSAGKTCSIGASYRDRIYVITGNGIVGWTKEGGDGNWVPSPDAPSLICLDKHSGKLLWQDHSPGTNILFGQWGSPLVAEIGGRAQVIAPLGDGWLRSFDALSGRRLWELDINPKSVTNRFLKNHFLNAPVLYQESIFIGGGEDFEMGDGPGSLFCIDPTRRGDVSLELADGPGRGKANPNSAVLWHFDSLGRINSQVAVHQGMVIAAGFEGYVHCLDAETGRPFWRHDMKARLLASPLIVDGKVYVGDEDGDFCILELSKEKRLLFSYEFGSPIWSSPVFANGVLYIANSEMLYAIQQGASLPPSITPAKP